MSEQTEQVEQKPVLTGENFLNAMRGRLRIEPVTVDGVTVYVKELTAAEMGTYEQELLNADKLTLEQLQGDNVSADISHAREKYLVRVLCDKVGNLLFKPADYGRLGEALGLKATNKLLEVAYRINGQDPEAANTLGN